MLSSLWDMLYNLTPRFCIKKQRPNPDNVATSVTQFYTLPVWDIMVRDFPQQIKQAEQPKTARDLSNAHLPSTTTQTRSRLVCMVCSDFRNHGSTLTKNQRTHQPTELWCVHLNCEPPETIPLHTTGSTHSNRSDGLIIIIIIIVRRWFLWRHNT